MSGNDTGGSERLVTIDAGRCPDCGSEETHWRRGHVADFDLVCEGCGGRFDPGNGERVGTHKRYLDTDSSHG